MESQPGCYAHLSQKKKKGGGVNTIKKGIPFGTGRKVGPTPEGRRTKEGEERQ